MPLMARMVARRLVRRTALVTGALGVAVGWVVFFLPLLGSIGLLNLGNIAFIKCTRMSPQWTAKPVGHTEYESCGAAEGFYSGAQTWHSSAPGWRAALRIDLLVRSEASTADLEKFLQTNPRDPIARYLLGATYLRTDRNDAALATWGSLGAWGPIMRQADDWYSQGKCDLALVWYRSAADLKYMTPGALLRLASCYASLGQTVDAIEAATESAKSSPSSDAFVLISREWLDKGDLDKAEEAARRALTLEPKSVEANQSLGEIMFMRDNLAEAEAIFNRIHNDDPSYPWAYYWHAKVLTDMREYPAAIEELTVAANLMPNNGWPYLQLGIVYHRLGCDESANWALDRAAQLREGASASLYAQVNAERRRAHQERSAIDYRCPALESLP